ncbi:MAG: hypothetical protein KKE20_02240 [Nanoarchaeota archaeon]|nr:hypothetical protein [Nanoarchaeota archaeon]
MRKISGIFMALLMVLSMVPAVIAQEGIDEEMSELEGLLDSFLEVHQVSGGNILLTQLKTESVPVNEAEYDISLIDVSDNEDRCGIQVSGSEVSWIDIDTSQEVGGITISVHYVEIVKGAEQDLDVCEISVEGYEPSAEDSSETENDTGSDEETQTEEEIGAMTNVYGSKMRLLQLERSITRNILRGEKVVAFVIEKGGDASELQAILAELEAVKEEIAAADPASEDAVEAFVDLKKDAMDLSKRFRDAARELLKAGDVLEIRNRLRVMESSEINSLTGQIREQKREHNAEMIRNALNSMNIQNEGLVNRIRTGEATVGEVRQEIRKDLTAMQPAQRRTALQNALELRTKRAVETQQKIDQARLNSLERRQTRLEQRAVRLEQIEGPEADAIRAHIEARIQEMEESGEQLGESIETRAQRRENIINSESDTSSDAE